jgi:integrase
VDFEHGYLRVRYQRDRKSRQRVPLKTDSAERDVVLMPALGELLREHRLASLHSRDSDFVFPARLGGGPAHTLLGRALTRALTLAGIGIKGFTFHDLRHTFASLLIAQGRDVVFVSGQLGHATPTITLSIYSHLFDQARHADAARDALERDFGNALVNSAGDGRRDGGVVEVVNPALALRVASAG